MRISVHLSDDLVSKAMRYADTDSYQEMLEQALEEFIAVHRSSGLRGELGNLLGRVLFGDDDDDRGR